MDNLLAQDITLAAQGAAYDSECKRLLANKHILSYILKHCVEEFNHLPIRTILTCINGEPEIGDVGVNPDWSRGKNGSRIVGLNTEDSTISEHIVRYDIKFDVVVPGTQTAQEIRLIINLEAQNKFHNGYELTTRAFYYGARLISAQYGSIFEGEDYGQLQKVYTIWICMNVPKSKQNTITEFSFQPKNIVGAAEFTHSAYDMMRMVMVCLGDGENASSELLRLLDTLFYGDVGVSEKLNILEHEFDIPMTYEFEKGVGNMCNFSLGFYEQGIAKGIEKGMEQGMEQGMEKGMAQGIGIGESNGELRNAVSTLRSLMKKMRISFDEAIDMVGYSEELAVRCKEVLQASDTVSES